MIVIPPTFGLEGPSALVDWFARMLVVELAIVSVAAGTYPIVRRGAITAEALAARVGLPRQVDRIRRALRESFAAGLLVRRGPDESEIAGLGRVSEMSEKAPPCIPPVSVSLPLVSDLTISAVSGKNEITQQQESVAGKCEAVSGKEVGKGKGKSPPSPPRQAAPEEVSVFDAWRKSFARSRVRLDETRLRAIRRALRKPSERGLGFSPAELVAAIAGYARDPWRRELPVRHELATLLRNAAQIETGIELGQGVEPIRRAAAAPAPGDDVSEARAEAARRRAPAGRGAPREPGAGAEAPPAAARAPRAVSAPIPADHYGYEFEELPT